MLPDLIECDFGDWEGLTFAEVRERWPDELDRWLDSTSVAPPGGESFQAVAKRVRGALATLRAAYPSGTVVVVSHVSPIKLILRDALAASDAFLHRLFLDAGRGLHHGHVAGRRDRGPLGERDRPPALRLLTRRVRTFSFLD